jgi:hypothetical protein
MATRDFEGQEQGSGDSNAPKFASGYEFLVLASYFGEKWASKTFGRAHRNFFLIGTVKKTMASKQKNTKYRVYFQFDKQSYTFPESQLEQQQSVEVLSSDMKREGGFVVIPSAMRKSWTLPSTSFSESQQQKTSDKTAPEGVYNS